MAPNHNKITGELCSIIEHLVFLDMNEEISPLYRRDEKYKFDANLAKYFSSNDPVVCRFKELLSTPNLDVNVSTSPENSLIGHAVMYICLTQEEVRAKGFGYCPVCCSILFSCAPYSGKSEIFRIAESYLALAENSSNTSCSRTSHSASVGQCKRQILRRLPRQQMEERRARIEADCRGTHQQ